MKDNILYKLSIPISKSLEDWQIKKCIKDSFEQLDNMYSYLIYAKYKNEALKGWLIECSFSQLEEYNTLKPSEIYEGITELILNSRTTCKSVIGYKQPDISIMLDLYKPLISKLSTEQCDKWVDLEYEDAISMCQLTMLKLYRKGYYIHKSLLKKSYENDVLLHLRHNKDKPDMISLEHVIHNDGDGEPITLYDVLPDKKLEEDDNLKEEQDFIKLVFNEVKDMIIDLIGERQFDQLMRDYGKKHTTPWSRKKMQQLKDKFKQLGISWKSFWRYK